MRSSRMSVPNNCRQEDHDRASSEFPNSEFRAAIRNSKFPSGVMNLSTHATAHALIAEGAERLQQAGIGPARQEAEWLLGALLGVRSLELYLSDAQPSPAIEEQFRFQIEARASGSPLQYLAGEAEFFGARFSVEPGVFIPRPETEVVVDVALQALRVRERAVGRPLRLLDLGTGSGCIAVTLARELPTCLLAAIELSWNTLCVARRNIRQYQVAQRVQLVHGWWLAPIGGRVDGIISNPPYVPSAQIDRLPLEVRREPRFSLDGGVDGMRDLWYLIEEAPRVLHSGGVLVLECGEEQVAQLLPRLATPAWRPSVTVINDLAGRPRGLLAIRC